MPFQCLGRRKGLWWVALNTGSLARGSSSIVDHLIEGIEKRMTVSFKDVDHNKDVDVGKSSTLLELLKFYQDLFPGCSKCTNTFYRYLQESRDELGEKRTGPGILCFSQFQVAFWGLGCSLMKYL
jgi:hypothetical protein